MEETFSKPRKYENGRYDDLLVNKVKMESMHERFIKQYSLVKNLKDLIGIYYDSCIEFSNKNAFKNIKLSQEEKLDKLTLGLNNTNIYIYSYIQSQKALYENLAKFIKEEVISYKLKENADKKEKELDNTNIFSLFESELGRTLSAMECEIIKGWLNDNISEVLLKEALKEAVYNDAKSLKYIDRILYTWKQKGIKTKEDIIKDKRNFRNSKKNKEVFDYNWLEEDDNG